MTHMCGINKYSQIIVSYYVCVNIKIIICDDILTKSCLVMIIYDDDDDDDVDGDDDDE